MGPHLQGRVDPFLWQNVGFLDPQTPFPVEAQRTVQPQTPNRMDKSFIRIQTLGIPVNAVPVGPKARAVLGTHFNPRKGRLVKIVFPRSHAPREDHSCGSSRQRTSLQKARATCRKQSKPEQQPSHPQTQGSRPALKPAHVDLTHRLAAEPSQAGHSLFAQSDSGLLCLAHPDGAQSHENSERQEDDWYDDVGWPKKRRKRPEGSHGPRQRRPLRTKGHPPPNTTPRQEQQRLRCHETQLGAQ